MSKSKLSTIIRIFLKLKAEEIWEKSAPLWPFSVLCLILAFYCFCSLSSNIILCFIWWYSAILVTILFILLLIYGLCCAIKDFIDWIKDNWRKAKEIATLKSLTEEENDYP